MYSTVYKYTLQSMVSAVCSMLSIDSACCSVSSHSNCLAEQTDSGLDHCCATRPCGLFLGQQTRAGSVGHLSLSISPSSCWKAQRSQLGSNPKACLISLMIPTILCEWIPFLPRGLTRAREDKSMLFGTWSHI